MPEMRFRIRWPDGSAETCYSPSLVIKDYFSRRARAIRSPILSTRSRTALAIASERVEAKYGIALLAAPLAQLARIETHGGATLPASPTRASRVDAFEE